MLKRTSLIPLAALAFMSPAFSVETHAAPSASMHRAAGSTLALVKVALTSDKEQEGLVGPVRRVRTETTKLNSKEGKLVEGPRVVLETATYDIKGNKTDNAYFLAAGGTLTGKEVYRYDERGNITEMTLFNTDGSLLSKEIYTYEFDAVGNWTKMTTSVAVVEGGKITYEPTEITYRAIAYYLEEATAARMTKPNAAGSVAQPVTSASVVQPAASRSAAPSPAPASNAASRASSNVAGQTKPDSSVKTSANVVAAATTTTAKKSASLPVALPELSADKSKVYAVSNPSVGSSVVAITNAGAPVVRDDSEAPPRPMPKAPVKPISGGVLNGKALNLPAPVYPTAAKMARASGVVSIEVVIDVTGKVISAQAVGGPVLLRQSAERAALQARFSPTLLSGQPVKVFGIINYNFNLGQ